MKPEEQRIAIAEWCGWEYRPNPKVIHPNKLRFWVAPWMKDFEGCGAPDSEVPDYLKDLNEIQGAVGLLNDRHKFTDDTRSMYYDYLALSCDAFPDKWEISWHVCSMATAAQRAEALLKTIGKWNE